jgi:hypothetical protein
MMATTTSELSLADMIMKLKDEIKVAQTADSAMFELGDVTIKTKVSISAKGKGGGKVSFYVVTAELGGELHNEHSHEVTITLKPKGKMFMGSRKR